MKLYGIKVDLECSYLHTWYHSMLAGRISKDTVMSISIQFETSTAPKNNMGEAEKLGQVMFIARSLIELEQLIRENECVENR